MTADDPMTAPVFVIGSMRSGSTLLRLVLDSHPHVAIPAETAFMSSVAAIQRVPQFKNGPGWHERIGWSRRELDAHIARFYVDLFGRWAREQGKQRWGEKTPVHVAHVETMAQVFPHAVFVGIVRHPGAVATSLGKNFHYPFGEAVAYWAEANRQLLCGALAVPGRFALLRYEDLVDDAEATLRPVCDFIGEPWSPALLAHHEAQRSQDRPRVTDGGTNTRDRIDAERAHRWSDGLSPADRVELEAVRGLASFFGYDATSTAPPQPWPGPGRLAPGVELARRAERAPGLDLRPPATPVLDRFADADPAELAERLARAEAALARVRSRRAVRVADALRRAQKGRSPAELRGVWSAVRGAQEGTR